MTPSPPHAVPTAAQSGGVIILRSAAIATLVLGLAAGGTSAAAEHPDLSGVWTNASVTKLTRSGGALVVSEAEARQIAAGANRGLDADSAPTAQTDRPPPEGNVGGYNAFWLDPGRALGMVKGERRTSWLVDPADGRLPLSDAGRKLIAEHRALHDSDRPPANPEGLEPWDRCLIGSRGSGGPGMLNNIYNSNYQIVQTPSSVVIVVEMIHDARTVPLFPDKATAEAHHGPAALRPWFGDSVGWWEGDALVVETVDVNPQQGAAGPIFLSPQARVTERLRRISPSRISYEFKVEDPAYYSQAWRAEMSLEAIKGPVYEYACHEGNYALVDILKGARAKEREAGGK
ncbi:MAG: hypothetical protein E7812_14800 [Phenylobacterium sp.]|nr:MAG: hypothetical protein E7812_14800 [Phenylobacterium sp.]